MKNAATVLFQSKARTGLLELVAGGLEASVSELARRLNLAQRGVAVEVKRLTEMGLLRVHSVGGADLVSFNSDHPAAKAVRALLKSPAEALRDDAEDQRVRESLASYGAPLAVEKAEPHFTLVETFIRAVELARRDGTVLRVLPSFVSAQRSRLDWREVTGEARRRKLKSEVGFVVELTAKLQHWPVPVEVLALKDGRRTTRRYFPEVRSSYERPLAEKRSPDVAATWGLWVNMSEDTFRSTLEKHAP